MDRLRIPGSERVKHLLWAPVLSVFLTVGVRDFLDCMIAMLDVALLQCDTHGEHSSCVKLVAPSPVRWHTVPLLVDGMIGSRRADRKGTEEAHAEDRESAHLD